MNISNLLSFFKYDPATQGALTFNIEQALNQNWDKIIEALTKVLMTYDASITYAENDLCISGGKIYLSKANSNAGNAVTNTTHWKDINNAADTTIPTALATALGCSANVEAAITALNASLSVVTDDRGYVNINTNVITDFNLMIKTGVYYVNLYDTTKTFLNAPTTEGTYTISVYPTFSSTGTAYIMQVAHNTNSGKQYKRNCDYQGNWSAWQEIATTETVELTLLNGWEKQYADSACLATRSGKVVTLNMSIKSGTMTLGASFLTLPTVYRPISTIVSPIFNSSGTSLGTCAIFTNGDITHGALTSNADVIVSVSYPVV